MIGTISNLLVKEEARVKVKEKERKEKARDEMIIILMKLKQ